MIFNDFWSSEDPLGDGRGTKRADLAAAQLSGGRRWLAGGHGACQGAHGRGRHPELYGGK